jgi:pimeloyl-ACP methyl ester carboxylesterase
MEAPTYKIADQVIGLSLLLRKLNIDTFSLGASSYGGVIASELILKGNFTINKLFLTNTPIKFSDPNDWDEILIDFGVSKKSDILIPRNAQQLKKIFQLSFYRKRYIPLFVFKKIYSQLYTKQANQRRLLVDSFVEEQIIFRDKEYRISCPVLLIWGKNDLLAPLIIGEKLVQYLGNKSQLIVFDRTGHMPNLEKSKKFNSMVLKFLLDD